MPRISIRSIDGSRAKFYGFMAKKSPIVKDFYQEVATEVCQFMTSGRILDVGTGPGYLPLEIVKKCPSIEAIGVDISKAMTEMARKNAERAGLSDRVKFLNEDGARMSMRDESVDFVVSTASLHHWSEPTEVIKDIHRVLKKGGQAWIYDIRRDAPKEVMEELRKRYGPLGPLGFRILKAHSSISLARVKILLDTSSPFKEYKVEELGPIMKIRLQKD